MLDEESSETSLSVVAGLAVLAGVAASDALCIRHLGYYAKGQDHDDAVGVLLRTGTPDSRQWSQTLKRLIDLKDEAHYGFYSVSTSKATSALKQGRLLVEAAIESFA
ncbi:MAG: HEPN domain-containing protein [Acidimicrobiales bacterium]